MIDIAAKVAPVLAEVRRLGPAISKAADTSALAALRRKVAPHIEAVAKTKVPMLFRVLLGSAAFHNVPGGAAITFGGMASAYAEKQHDDDSLSHSGPRAGHYVYQGFGGEKVGEWNAPRRGGKAQWRFSKVHYVKRHDASKFGPKVGQAHFLYGAPNSAWEEQSEWAVRVLIAAALAGAKAAVEHVRMAAGGGT